MRVHIKHIRARLPTPNCAIKFLIKESTCDTADVPSLLPLSAAAISMDLDVKMDVPAFEHTIELIVVAIAADDKIYIGRVDL